MAKGFKTGGRKKGTPNKLTREVRESLSAIIDNELEQLPEWLEQLDTKDRLDVLCKLLPYVLPKLRQTELSLSRNEKINHVTIEIIDPNEVKKNSD